MENSFKFFKNFETFPLHIQLLFIISHCQVESGWARDDGDTEIIFDQQDDERRHGQALPSSSKQNP